MIESTTFWDQNNYLLKLFILIPITKLAEQSKSVKVRVVKTGPDRQPDSSPIRNTQTTVLHKNQTKPTKKPVGPVQFFCF